jgi:hypothetical protein
LSRHFSGSGKPFETSDKTHAIRGVSAVLPCKSSFKFTGFRGEQSGFNAFMYPFFLPVLL